VSKVVGVKAELTYPLYTLSNRTLVFVGENRHREADGDGPNGL
jgi:hypothetical protein